MRGRPVPLEKARARPVRGGHWQRRGFEGREDSSECRRLPIGAEKGAEDYGLRWPAGMALVAELTSHDHAQTVMP